MIQSMYCVIHDQDRLQGKAEVKVCTCTCTHIHVIIIINVHDLYVYVHNNYVCTYMYVCVQNYVHMYT